MASPPITFWFRTQHQPKTGRPVEFELRPLEQSERNRFTVAIARSKDLTPDWNDLSEIFHSNVVGWRGIPLECSLHVRRSITSGEASLDWLQWIQEIVQKLYVQPANDEKLFKPAGQCGCCAECLAELPDHWLSDLWRYCPHHRTMSRRRSADGEWTIDHDISPKRASKHLKAAEKLMRAWARANGLDLAEVDRAITRLRTKTSNR